MTRKKTTGDSIPQGDFVTCREASELVRYSEAHIRRLLSEKKLKRYKVGHRTLILKSDVLALIRAA